MAEAGSKPTNFTRPFPFTSGGNDSSRGNGNGGAGGGGKGGAATKAVPYHSKRELLEDLLAMHASLTGSWRYPSSRTDSQTDWCSGSILGARQAARLQVRTPAGQYECRAFCP